MWDLQQPLFAALASLQALEIISSVTDIGFAKKLPLL
jgi:hypothetical protein